MKTWLAEARVLLTSIAAIASLLFFIGQPAAENFIKRTIKEQGYATQDTIVNMSGKLLQYNQTLEATNEELKATNKKLEAEKEQRIRLEERQQSILNALQETNRLLRQRRD